MQRTKNLLNKRRNSAIEFDSGHNMHSKKLSKSSLHGSSRLEINKIGNFFPIEERKNIVKKE